MANFEEFETIPQSPHPPQRASRSSTFTRSTSTVSYHTPKLAAVSHSLLRQFRHFFGLLDSDKSGKITVGEIDDLMKQIHPGCGADAFLLRKTYDEDNDGQIDFDEFLKMLTSYEINSEDVVKSAFEKFDLNRDGLLSAAELRTVLSVLGISLSREESEMMVLIADRDGDGFVGFEDFRRMMTQYI